MNLKFTIFILSFLFLSCKNDVPKVLNENSQISTPQNSNPLLQAKKSNITEEQIEILKNDIVIFFKTFSTESGGIYFENTKMILGNTEIPLEKVELSYSNDMYFEGGNHSVLFDCLNELECVYTSDSRSYDIGVYLFFIDKNSCISFIQEVNKLKRRFHEQN